MTERTRKIIDSAWVAMPDTQWPMHPGAQCIAGQWRYPRFGCDTVQHMIDMIDEALDDAVFRVPDKDARIIAEREWADLVMRLEAEAESLKRILRNIEGDCFDALTPEHINAIGAAIGRWPTPEEDP